MALEYKYQVVVFWNLIATSVWISLRFGTSFAVERPLHLSFFSLLYVGLFWSALRRWDQPQNGEHVPVKHQTLQTDELPRQYLALRSLKKLAGHGQNAFSACKPSSIALVTCTVIRALILRTTVLDVQCSWDGVEILLPFLLLLHELATQSKTTTTTTSRLRSLSETSPAQGRSLSVSVILMANLAILVFSASVSEGRSSYICPTRAAFVVRTLQVIGVFLDAGIIIAIMKLTRDVDSKDSLRALSQMALASAWIISFLACLYLFINSEHVHWSLRLDHKIVVDLIFASLLGANFIASAVYLLRELRPVTIFTIATCILVYFSALQQQLISNSFGQAAFIIMSLNVLTSLGALMRLERNQSRFQQRSGLNGKASKTLTFIFIFILTTTLFFTSRLILRPSVTTRTTNPIKTLITNARETSDAWISQAGKSKSLKEATSEYQARYNIPPPPGFDKWYAFASSRNSIIIDSFDQIHHDLQPFWGMEPSHIRQLTSHTLDRPWTEIAGLRIINGTTQIGKHMPPTHRWMMEGATEILNTFSEHLPDMDLAFNLNDESRVAVPWAEMNVLMEAANAARRQLSQAKTLQSSFSENTPSTWQSGFMDPEPPFPPDSPSEFFTEASITPSFDSYGSVPCPPFSAARRQKWWKKQKPCHACLTPHSLDLYIANWTLAGSPCHQPDISNLHGFHLSPSAFKGTNFLIPVFSQSKIPSFSDILFPSPWNYMRKVSYDEKEDVPFSDKNDTFFWRGATSEGFSIGGAWKGMQRQRFVHLSNHTLPNALRDAKTNVNVSVSFVQNPIRCGDSDCYAESRNFAFSEPVEWKEHWKHKFLLDLDGAGFSGRFLPFLESNSLVLRAAAFRQWFEERLTPWRDFVPLDARGGDLSSLVEYFAGSSSGDQKDGSGGGKEAERIGRDGGDRAKKTLRREDMEVYMFRLLLEWGRIVDDKRGEMGFVYVDEKGGGGGGGGS